MVRKIPGMSAELAEQIEKDFSGLRGLTDLPDALIEAHLKLYAGYVRNVNLLRQHLAAQKEGTPEWCEMQRRIGFELNGMRLHELYFGNLCPGGAVGSRGFRDVLSVSGKTSDAWEREFRAIGSMRGVGWAILYRDPETRRLSNHWIGMHEEGHPAGFSPILVMDVWEHAFTGMDRARYIDAFFANINWEEVESRLDPEAQR